MKKWVVLFFICSEASIFPQITVSPEFSELKGIEDQQGNTHLFYRIYSLYDIIPVYSSNNDVYHFDLNNLSDSLFLNDFVHRDPVMEYSIQVNDYVFWNNDVSKFIYGGTEGGFEASPFIKRFDEGLINLNFLCCGVNHIDISSEDDSIIYAGGELWGEVTAYSIRSSNGGFNWNPVFDTLKFISLSSVSDEFMFFEDFSGNLYRSTDGAGSFHLVDVLSEWGSSNSFIYDPDQLHICRIFKDKTLRVSSNQGEAFSWQTKYSSDSKIFISNDESVSGTIYLADKKNIFVSTNFGNNFSLYNTLDRKIVGIYKKPNSDKLYAATKYKIYEITPDTIQIIKSLPAIDDLQWYPLEIGNKWVYEYYRQPIEPPGIKEFIGFSVMEVVGDTLIDSKSYYLLKNEPLYWNIDTGLVRPDSLEAKLFIYLPDENNELVYEDFLTQAGDTTWIDSIDFKVLVSEESFEVFGMNTSKRTIEYPFRSQGYELVKNVGLYFWGFSDFFAFYMRELKGCVIDGIVYGDTTTVGVESDEAPIVNEFRLEQNFPNPFNPTTNIGFRISNFGFVSLKVYDILGNEIATLVNEELSAGEYEVEFDATNLPSGIYFYHLKSGSYIQAKKMILLK